MLHLPPQPLRFEPFLRPMPWGGRRLARFLGKNMPTAGPYGESWEVSDHSLHRSRLATATGYGITLRQLMMEDRQALLGHSSSHAIFPWLIKLLDVQDWLSVQVHPDEAAVAKLCPGESAKSEAWLIVDAAPGARIYAGLRQGVGPEQMRAALARGSVVDCLHSFAPEAGDFVFLPAGTVHAVGGGALLAEIQQTSDATFRLFDWDRRDAHGNARQLHVAEALASIHWDQGAVEPIRTAGQRLLACPFFEIDRIAQWAPAHVGGSDRLQALVLTAGQGRFENGEFAMAGDVWLLPAALPATPFHVETPLSGLLCTLP